MNSLQSSACIALTLTAVAGLAFAASANESAGRTEPPAKNLLTENPRLQQLLAEANRSSGPEEILRLADAGVDPVVIQKYVESSGRRYDLDADQIIQLHQRGLNGGVISTMIRRGAKPEVQTSAPAPAPVAPTVIQVETVTTQPASTVTYIHTRPRAYSFAYRPLYASTYPYAYHPSAYYGYGGIGACYYRSSYWNYRPAWWSDFRYRGCW